MLHDDTECGSEAAGIDRVISTVTSIGRECNHDFRILALVAHH